VRHLRARTRVFSTNRIARRKTLWHDHTDGSYTIETMQDVSPIMEVATGRMNLHDGIHFKEDWAHVATVPVEILLDLYKQGIRQDEAAYRRWLDHPDNRCWRTHPGKLSKTSR